MASGEWNDVFAKIQRKGVLIDRNVLKENFEDVINKTFDRDMGFGYISDNGYKPKARVILQGKNPFINNHTDLLNPILGNHLPYSQVYHLAWGAGGVNGGRTYCILRHYLNIPGLSEEELDSIKIATCSLENMDSIDYMVERMEGKNINEENYSVTVSEEERKQSFSENGNNVEKKPTQRLLEQMNQIISPIVDATGDGLASGQLVVTVHKASSLEKKGLVGKADPYVVLKYGTQTEKSATVNNNHNPIWHFTACFDIEEQSTSEIAMEVFDDDFGKDDFLGKAIIDIHDIIESTDFVNKWIPLENCKTGEVLVSAKFIPLQRISRPVGHISLTVQKGKKIEKKSMMKKADPYVVIKLGKDQHKSETVKKSTDPTWNYDFAFDIMEASPRQITFEVFDDDIGNDRPIGNVTLDTDTIMKKQKLDNLWTRLENSKSGEILISAEFTPAPAIEDNEEEIGDTTTNIEMEVIDEQFEENKVQKIALAEKNLVNKNQPNGNHHAVEFIDPVYCDDEYVIVEKKDNNWFMVVSSNPNLPINVNLVPFKQNSAENSPIYIYPIPSGGFHNIKRVVHSGRGLKQCGYEKPCVLRAGQAYQFWTDIFNLGNLKTETWGPDTSWVVYKPEYIKGEDCIEASLKLADENELKFSGSISLYDRLSVDAA